ncbi:hypothetical protein [Staphylococcus hominis]|uniref:hypothetical protein n=2 Tax=Staphylococcus hominis TaxID=1290 RepID=UPI003204DDF0
MPQRSKINYRDSILDDENLDIISIENDILDNGFIETPNLFTNTKLENHLTLTSKVAKKTLEPAFIGGMELDVEVGSNTSVGLSLSLTNVDENIKKIISGFSYFDRMVHDVVATFYESGNRNFTPKNVIRHLKEENENYNPSPKLVKDVKNSIERMGLMKVSIDFSEQKNWKTIKELGLKRLKLKNYMLPLKELEIEKINNNEAETHYAFMDQPPLLFYSKIIHHVETIDREVITTPATMQQSRDTLEVTAYISERISNLRSGNKKIQPKISWKTLFEKCKFEFTEPNYKENKHKEYIANRLVKDGYIRKRQSSEDLKNYIQRSIDYVDSITDKDFNEYYKEIELKTKKTTNNYIDRKRKNVKNDVEKFLEDKKEKGFIKDFQFVGTTTKGNIKIKM